MDAVSTFMEALAARDPGGNVSGETRDALRTLIEGASVVTGRLSPARGILDADRITNAEAALALALAKAELGCVSRKTGAASLARMASAGLGAGLSLPFLADVDPAVSASLLLGGSVLGILHEGIVRSSPTTDVATNHPVSSDQPKAEPMRRERWWRRFARRAGQAVPVIAVGAATSGVGSFIGDVLKEGAGFAA